MGDTRKAAVTSPKWTLSQAGDTVEVHTNVPKTAAEVWFLLRGDAHHDSPFSNHEAEKKHLDKALELNAGIIDFGDLFDAMQGREDKRRRKSELADRFQRDAYFDEIIDDAESFYAPYKDNWIAIARGNHEDSVLQHYGTDLTRRLSRRLECFDMDYEGFIRFKFTVHKTVRMSKLLYYSHGSGGSSPVTRGVLWANRKGVWLPDPDIYVGAHLHTQWSLPVPVLKVSERGSSYRDVKWFLQVPSYKDRGPWEKRKGFAPSNIGAWWLKFEIVGTSKSSHLRRYVVNTTAIPEVFGGEIQNGNQQKGGDTL